MKADLSLAPFRELESDTPFGPALKEKDWASDWECHVAESPVCFGLRELYESSELVIPKALDLYKQFRVWMIPHRLNIIKRARISKPISVEIEVEFRNDGPDVNLNKSMTVFVISQIPSPEFFTRGKVDAEISGKITASGSAEVAGFSSNFGQIVLQSGGLSIGGGMSVDTSLRFRQQIVTPTISAVGVGSSRANWLFTEGDVPLYGRDIEAWSILAVPKRKTSLDYRLRVRLLMGTRWFKTPRETNWFPMSIRLES